MFSKNNTWTSGCSIAPFFPLLNHGGGEVLTEPDCGARSQDRDHHGPEEGGQEGHHGQRGGVNPVLQSVGLLLVLLVMLLVMIVRRGGGKVSRDRWKDGTNEGIDRWGKYNVHIYIYKLTSFADFQSHVI